MRQSAIIVTCAGQALSRKEEAFFRECRPCGFILFERHCQSPPQVKALVRALRACCEGYAPFIMIDQEGGRVSRLKPPHWRAEPPCGRLGELYATDKKNALKESFAQGKRIAQSTVALGIDVVAAPVLDVLTPHAHAVIGDRAFGASPEAVAALGGAFMDGIAAGGAISVMKHAPGHGAGRVDSHVDLPTVDDTADALAARDYVPFCALAAKPHGWMMTAHILYTALDSVPATFSRVIVRDVIRGAFGFGGVVVSDDLHMGALADIPLKERARRARAAGHDAVLYCDADLAAMRSIAEGAGVLDAASLARFEAARLR